MAEDKQKLEAPDEVLDELVREDELSKAFFGEELSDFEKKQQFAALQFQFEASKTLNEQAGIGQVPQAAPRSIQDLQSPVSGMTDLPPQSLVPGTENSILPSSPTRPGEVRRV